MTVENARFFADFGELANLKAQARADQAGAAKIVAKQFEAVFVQMMVKQMRQSSGMNSLLDSKQSLFYRDMFDQQLSKQLSESGHGIGLAQVIERQLKQGNTSIIDLDEANPKPIVAELNFTPRRIISAHARPTAADHATESAKKISIKTDATVISPAKAPREVREMANLATPPTAKSVKLDGTPATFISELKPIAQKAADELGLPVEALLAQAALETGWGKHVIHQQNQSSHNLFGIKADNNWQGDSASKESLEYFNGVAVKTRSPFRAYASFEQSFADYAHFIRSNPRYTEALKHIESPERYFVELEKAGYATDPRYAEKISEILQRPEFSSLAQTEPVKANTLRQG